MATKFIDNVNPWTRKEYRLVPRPNIQKPAAGKTKYDELFDHLLKTGEGAQFSVGNHGKVRKGWQRYIHNRNITTHTLRQMSLQGTITFWTEAL